MRRLSSAKARIGAAAPSAYPMTPTSPTSAPTSGGAKRIHAPMPEARKESPSGGHNC
jgi:hypothetical protein